MELKIKILKNENRNTKINPFKINMAAGGRGILLTSSLYISFAGYMYIADYFKLSKSPENLMCGKSYFDFNGLYLFQKRLWEGFN